MKKDFYFFRHGQTDLNVCGVWQGCSSDVVLNATGEEQAKRLAEKVKDLHLTNLYCSPMLRAVQTANIIARGIRLYEPIAIYQNLRECNFGLAEGLTFEESCNLYGKNFVDDILYPTKKTWMRHFPKGESKSEVFERVCGCLAQIINSTYWKGQNRIGIVCHAGVINALQCGFALQNVSYDNCSILHLTCGGDCVAPEVKDLVQVFDV